MRIGILENNNFSKKALMELKQIGNVYLYDGKNLKNFLEKLDVLFIRVNYKINKDFLNQAKNLKYICSPTTGHSHIDETSISESNIKLLSLRGETRFLRSVRATPEHTIGIILALIRKYHFAFKSLQKHGWGQRDLYLGEELFNRSVGIIGLGRVGYRVASILEEFGAIINFFDISKVRSKKSWILRKDIQDLINHSSVVLLLASFKNGQKPIIDKTNINLLNNKYFINTARGELIDEKLIIKLILANKLKGFATDVISDGTNNLYLNDWKSIVKNKNVIITPHIGGVTQESLEKTELFMVKKLKRNIQNANK